MRVTDKSDTQNIDRRTALRRLGLAFGAAYMAPVVLSLSEAGASSDASGSSGSSDSSGPSPASAPSAASTPSAASGPSGVDETADVTTTGVTTAAAVSEARSSRSGSLCFKSGKRSSC